MNVVKNHSVPAKGRQIKKQLIEKGMTQRELASAVGMTPEYLCRVIRGERSGKKYLPAIKQILNMSETGEGL